jgi:hypothetical protein
MTYIKYSHACSMLQKILTTPTKYSWMMINVLLAAKLTKMTKGSNHLNISYKDVLSFIHPLTPKKEMYKEVCD